MSAAVAGPLATDDVRCFARAFTADYLADPRNDALAIVEVGIIVDAREAAGGDTVRVLVRAMPRDRYGVFVAGDGVCRWEEDANRYRCEMSCSGRFDVAINDDGTASLLNTGGFTLGTVCATQASAGERTIPADDAHAAFTLQPLPVDACPIDLFAMYGAN